MFLSTTSPRLEHHQGRCFHYLPGQPIPVPDQSFREVFPNANPNLPWCNLRSFPSHPITSYLGEEVAPHLNTTSFQTVAEGSKGAPSQFPQSLVVSLVLQSPQQLWWTSLNMPQGLSVCSKEPKSEHSILGAASLELSTRGQPHHCSCWQHYL